MANYRLKAYETFTIREGWLAKALRALHDPKVFQVNYGADALGVGTNMAKSIRYWTRCCGLTEERSNKGTFLTELGQIIYTEDPYVENPFTLFILHCNIARNFEQATSWSVFFNDFDITSFTKSELNSAMMDLLLERTGEGKLPEKSVNEDCGSILSMYCAKETEVKDPEDNKTCPFTSLGLISRNGAVFEKSQPFSTKLTSDVVLYLISDRLAEEGSLQIDDIVDGIDMPGKILNLSRIKVNAYLDELEKQGFVTVNRTAGLDIVYPKNLIDCSDIVRNHYQGF